MSSCWYKWLNKYISGKEETNLPCRRMPNNVCWWYELAKSWKFLHKRLHLGFVLLSDLADLYSSVVLSLSCKLESPWELLRLKLNWTPEKLNKNFWACKPEIQWFSRLTRWRQCVARVENDQIRCSVRALLALILWKLLPKIKYLSAKIYHN